MYLHVGNNKNIRIKEIIGIFDTDNATVSTVTRRYLSEAEKRGEIEVVGYEIPKSFIVYIHKGKRTVCLSPLSSSSLLGRISHNR
ncbi:MAG: DUF370 domain-containing protein [Ruminococcaceae bacterium]|nr:DUF370 domain-containing protein [Oscillospiraceae bacterium]